VNRVFRILELGNGRASLLYGNFDGVRSSMSVNELRKFGAASAGVYARADASEEQEGRSK
jgi:hypothetical protein